MGVSGADLGGQSGRCFRKKNDFLNFLTKRFFRIENDMACKINAFKVLFSAFGVIFHHFVIHFDGPGWEIGRAVGSRVRIWGVNLGIFPKTNFFFKFLQNVCFA